MSVVTVQKMLPEHIGEVKTLLDICFGEAAWSVGTIASQLEKPDSSCYVAVDSGKVTGYLAFEQIADEGGIIELAVHPDRRRQGIAKRLIETAVDGTKGLSEIFLEVRGSNLSAISLYGSLGFERIAVRKNYYDSPKEDAVIMKKNIL